LAGVENIQTSTKGSEACAVNFKTPREDLEERYLEIKGKGKGVKPKVINSQLHHKPRGGV